MNSFKQFLIEAVTVAPVPRWRVPPVLPGKHKEDARSYLTLALEADGHRIMAVENKFIVGAASYYVDGTDVIVENIGSVQPGAGSALMRYIIDHANRIQAHRIVLFASESSDDFYAKLGFKDAEDGQDGHKELVLKSPSGRR